MDCCPSRPPPPEFLSSPPSSNLRLLRSSLPADALPPASLRSRKLPKACRASAALLLPLLPTFLQLSYLCSGRKLPSPLTPSGTAPTTLSHPTHTMVSPPLLDPSCQHAESCPSPARSSHWLQQNFSKVSSVFADFTPLSPSPGRHTARCPTGNAPARATGELHVTKRHHCPFSGDVPLNRPRRPTQPATLSSGKCALPSALGRVPLGRPLASRLPLLTSRAVHVQLFSRLRAGAPGSQSWVLVTVPNHFLGDLLRRPVSQL